MKKFFIPSQKVFLLDPLLSYFSKQSPASQNNLRVECSVKSQGLFESVIDEKKKNNK